VITARQIQEYLKAKPFKPFRLFLSDGSSHDVPHPEFAWVFGSTVFIGVAGKSTKAPEDFVKQVESMSVLDLSNLVKALEDRFGVSAAAAVDRPPAKLSILESGTV